ncbi:MAG: hypothetical protein SFX72_16195 [Isosphaeraceae bacterium]|jgi:hypothetical protein|nr:hypothetical protein [Isosphaeraceae bacterium]
MRRTLFSTLILGSLAAFSGCGDDNEVSEIKQSEAATKADEAGRKAIEDMMKTKNPTKPSAAKSAEAPK